MSLLNAYKGSKILETLENYSLSTNTLSTLKRTIKSTNDNNFYEDKRFWQHILKNPEATWYKLLNLRRFVVSDWVARVPGLYYAEYSKSLRSIIDEEIAVLTKNIVELHPTGKSKMVLGGIGTLLFPPDDEGKRLISVSSSCNASLGIPVLIYPEVWESLSINQGNIVDILNCKWQPMSLSWAKRFASTKNIPRGCLIVDNPKKIKVFNTDQQVIYHPFSIMEYENKDAILYDYVFVTVDSKLKSARKETEKFFKYYASKESRNGKYLLNPDMISPIFEAQYMSPSEMQDPSEKAKLELLTRRITNANFNLFTLNDLINILPHYYNSSIAIKRLAKSIGISQAILKEDNAANMSAQLINYCLQINKIEELTDRMMVEYPVIFKP